MASFLAEDKVVERFRFGGIGVGFAALAVDEKLVFVLVPVLVLVLRWILFW